jgi:hypothetical protein
LQATSSVSGRGSAVAIGLAGWATVRAPSDQVAALRRNPGLPTGTTLSPGFLKNADEQTVLALAATSRAMFSMGRPTASYANWGVVAAANLFGRSGTFQSLLDFRRDGAWGVTPHLIPHHSLHSISGTVSQALRIHGPNFGISGGPSAVAEAFLGAATMISDNNLPGLWVVLTGHDPDCLVEGLNQDTKAKTHFLAAAVALEPPTSAKSASYLYISGADNTLVDWPALTLPEFVRVLESNVLESRWVLPGCGWVRLGGIWEESP